MTQNKVLAIIGCDADKQTVDFLSSLGFSVQILPRHTSLPLPVSSHADMLMFELDGVVFTERKYFEYARNVFDKISEWGYDIVCCDISLEDNYPHDIAFNIAVCGNALYGNIKHNANEIIAFAKEKALMLNSVKQGYTKCSTVVLGSKAIITADAGIASAAEQNGTSVLKINNSPDSVSLKGYNYGFIGGASSVYGSNVYFSGNIDLHSEGKEIKEFCNRLGFNVVCLSTETLQDIGGIIFLPYRD